MKKITLIVVTVLLVVACKSKNEPSIPVEEGTVIVQLEPEATTEMLMEQFEMANLSHKKVISKPMRVHLFAFNKQKIELEKLLVQLKKSEIVRQAQTNKAVSNRN